jgi:hypothetical protein
MNSFKIIASLVLFIGLVSCSSNHEKEHQYHGNFEKIKALEIIMYQHGAEGIQKFEKKQVEFVIILKLKIEELTAKQSSNWNHLKENL